MGTFDLCTDDETGQYEGKAHFVDKASVWSVRDAVNRLNTGMLVCEQDWVVVYSDKFKMWFALYKPGERDAAWAHFFAPPSEHLAHSLRNRVRVTSFHESI